MDNINFRVGYGYDVHRFSEGRKLMLGGVEIPYEKGLLGHSDADVLLHAICDALLGAAGFEDIGHQFPNTDPAYKDIPSILLLEKVCALLSGAGWKTGNVDSMIQLEEPKIYKHIPEMKNRISGVLGCENISIKATTAEGLGFIGSKKGCSASASVLIYK
ncbi:MAG: 2-C-methyl-D-erythritol 2,4-cyclodiphosphate synthase [Ignavibacteria bacterium]|jgi:2-C-methyl-D-erythritol 2,4-cyclodiphosphate synthase|nr:2-C-methyl-D-erythritol 2,4-cyclodiphosphate synthase [Ignavibacteria bacterium]